MGQVPDLPQARSVWLAALPELALRQRRKGLAKLLQPVTEILRGSLVERCGPVLSGWEEQAVIKLNGPPLGVSVFVSDIRYPFPIASALICVCL